MSIPKIANKYGITFIAEGKIASLYRAED